MNLLAYIKNPIIHFQLVFHFFVSKFDFRFSDCLPEIFTESEIQVAIGNTVKRAPDRKDDGGRQKTNNTEQRGDDEQDDDHEQSDNEQDDDEQDH